MVVVDRLMVPPGFIRPILTTVALLTGIVMAASLSVIVIRQVGIAIFCLTVTFGVTEATRPTSFVRRKTVRTTGTFLPTV